MMTKLTLRLFPFLVFLCVFACLEIGREAAGKEWPIRQTNHSWMLMPSSQVPPLFGKYIENINGVQLELARMPQGSFLMGNDRSPNPEEKPAHQVNLKSFYIGQYEITRKQWNIVAESLPKVSLDLRRQYIDPPNITGGFEETTPADIVFWDSAVEFCERLTRFTGKRYRLPSEAEWEYACRAGTTTEYSFGDEVNYNLAHLKDRDPNNNPFYLLPVGAKGYANAWGLYDMHGNVAELCSDVEHPNYIGAPSDGSAWTLGGDQRGRRLRGGMYDLRAEFSRSSARFFWDRYLSVSGLGFRVVAEISPTVGVGRVTVTSAANYSNAGLASEAIAALFGSNLSGETQITSNTPLPISLAGASIIIKDGTGNEYATPLFFTSPNQINFQIPSGLTLGTATVYAVNNGNIHSTGAIEITRVSPGLFSADASGTGLAAAVALRVRANGEQIYEPVGQFDTATNRFVPLPIDVSNPAEHVYLILFGTGFRNRSDLANVSARIAGANTPVLFAGAQGGLVGLDQCNIRLLSSLAGSGEVGISLTVENKTSNTVKIGLK